MTQGIEDDFAEGFNATEYWLKDRFFAVVFRFFLDGLPKPFSIDPTRVGMITYCNCFVFTITLEFALERRTGMDCCRRKSPTFPRL
jgi:hypothetical protein